MLRNMFGVKHNLAINSAHDAQAISLAEKIINGKPIINWMRIARVELPKMRSRFAPFPAKFSISQLHVKVNQSSPPLLQPLQDDSIHYRRFWAT